MSVASSSPHASRDPRLSPSPAVSSAGSSTSISTRSLSGTGSSRPSYIPPKTVIGRALGNELHPDAHKPASPSTSQRRPSKDGVGMALSDTPLSTAPSSPQIRAQLHTPTSVPSSTAQTPKPRATTLDIPGLTRSKVSPDGRIPERDVGSKLVIVMVGLPARGKSYVTKKLARYLNWLQHDTRIFNVGERRRLAAGNSPSPSMLRSKDRSESSITQELVDSVRKMSVSVGNPMPSIPSPPAEMGDSLPPPAIPTEILVNGERVAHPGSEHSTPDVEHKPEVNVHPVKRESIDQSASFFDPHNQQAVQLREQVALATLDELLDYILDQGGSVGILDATNSTLERRKTIMDRIRERAGPELGVLFLESRCVDPVLLESNMRLKLSGPDYHDQDPVEALEDFKKRVAMYDESYVPLGEYEEKNDMAYVQMIDVGRKVVAHQTNGFLSSQVVYYLMNFNLSPRQIWITRHGESIDNQLGRIGGDSELSENGHKYGEALARFIDHQKGVWEEYQAQKAMTSHFPPHPGDSTPPNPSYGTRDRPRNFCVWSSMMKRAIQTTSYFNDDDYDIKQMRMLDELYAGKMEGMTYEEIKAKYPEEYENRRKEKLQYRYPGPGGEGYLDVINRLRAVIVEVERTTDHVLLVTHRSVARVLLAYFLGLSRDEVAGLDVPLGVLYMLEPKPYGVDFKAYRYNPQTNWFDYIPDFKLRQTHTI